MKNRKTQKEGKERQETNHSFAQTELWIKNTYNRGRQKKDTQTDWQAVQHKYFLCFGRSALFYCQTLIYNWKQYCSYDTDMSKILMK